MKSRVICAAVLALALFAGGASAADRIGFIDQAKVLVSHPKYEETQKHLDKFAEERLEEAKKQSAEVSGDEREAAEKRRFILEFARNQCGEEEARVMKPIEDQINAAIRAAAKDKGVTVVIIKELVYLGGTDLTDAVVKELQGAK